MGNAGDSDEILQERLQSAAVAGRPPQVVYREDYIVNDRGVKLFTCEWVPAGQEPRALVFICHGYGMECSVFMKDTGERLARAGFAVYGIDYEGHGKSEGRRCFINKFSNIISDAATHFISIQDRKENRGKQSFLYGESMGGAVALLLNRKEPSRWRGMVLVAPMAKIAEKMRPSPFMISVLWKLNGVAPGWKIVPVGDIFQLAFKIPEKRERIKANTLLYHGKPRIRTALEMYQTTLDLEGRLDEVTLPFLLLHGEDDTVTDPEVSKALLDQSRSFDKTMKLYKGLWHGLTSGEEEKDIDMVFDDIIQWLGDRSLSGHDLPVDLASDHEATTTRSNGASHERHSEFEVSETTATDRI